LISESDVPVVDKCKTLRVAYAKTVSHAESNGSRHSEKLKAPDISSANGAPDSRQKIVRQGIRKCKNPADALHLIQNVLTKLVDCEQMALFRVDSRKGVLWLSWSSGLAARGNSMLDTMKDVALQSVVAGQPYIAESPISLPHQSHQHSAIAYFPVRINGEALAVLAIYKLSPKKLCIDAADSQIISLLCEGIAPVLFPASRNAGHANLRPHKF
jgi:hypothetical protein